MCVLYMYMIYSMYYILLQIRAPVDLPLEEH